ncbi:MAG: Flp pilus assembly protein CpaB [Comamonadaceae bacterium]|nr:Flp pilus assembly protein CpaB [Comamonadaceae bacterium]
MKNFKAIGLLLAALVLGLVAAVYAAGWVARQSDSASAQVVVAAVDVELGTRLTPQMLAVVQWPTGALPSGAFGDAAQLQDRVLRAGVLKGEPIVDRKLAAVGSQGGLSAVIAQGKRAMTVRVNDVVGVAGFALPGTFVDVMVNTRQDKGRGEEAQISKTGAQRGHLVAGLAQPGRSSAGEHNGHHQAAVARCTVAAHVGAGPLAHGFDRRTGTRTGKRGGTLGSAGAPGARFNPGTPGTPGDGRTHSTHGAGAPCRADR